MNLLDCTLRDGANVVGNGFSAELTISIIEGLLDSGITTIELGNAKGIGAYEMLNSTAPLTDEEYMKLAGRYADRGEMGLFMLSKCAKTENVRLAKKHGISFIRVGNNAGDGAMSFDAVKMVKDADLTCRYSLMKAYIRTPEELAEEAVLLEGAGVDAITIMDSAGTMTPKQAFDYVKAMKEKVAIPVGFHGHNNLGLSQANALAAMEAGADELDCGLLGMARSAGNCSTELLVAALQRENQLANVDLYKLLQYLDDALIPAMAKYDYHTAVKPEDLILGMSGCHSTFFKTFQKIAQQAKVPLYPLIVKVSEIDQKAPSEQLILQVAETLNA